MALCATTIHMQDGDLAQVSRGQGGSHGLPLAVAPGLGLAQHCDGARSGVQARRGLHDPREHVSALLAGQVPADAPSRAAAQRDVEVAQPSRGAEPPEGLPRLPVPGRARGRPAQVPQLPDAEALQEAEEVGLREEATADGEHLNGRLHTEGAPRSEAQRYAGAAKQVCIHQPPSCGGGHRCRHRLSAAAARGGRAAGQVLPVLLLGRGIATAHGGPPPFKAVRIG
mmetsp:Transcript_19719/g.62549  ORF Transcript_19719/g.62549 Transcript_19719/m.62549 type:complete len:226 (-) Transcript_19719:77-754(-)